MEEVEKLSRELPFLKEIDELKNEVDKKRPLSKDLSAKIFQKLRLDWNYNSNAIEGNSFTYGETIALLMEGITAKGKPLKDALDIKGHNDAIDLMMDMVKNDRELNEADIRSLHQLVLGKDYYNDAITADGLKTRKLIKAGQYKTMPNHVQTATGEIHYYASPEETPKKMEHLVKWYNQVIKTKGFHPVVLASLFHHRFVAIHPFDDGNGRMTRILTNFILLKFDYPVSVLKNDRKTEYYSCLSQADNGQVIPIIEFIAKSVRESLQIYIKAIAGEDISEPDDIDKEIALFRKEMGYKMEIKELRQNSSATIICFRIFSYLSKKINKFSDLFMSKSEIIKEDSKNKSFILTSKMENESSYKEIVKQDLENSKYVGYNYNLNHFIHKRENRISIKIDIHFKKENYIIYFNNQKVVKYYDEEILDLKCQNLLDSVVQDVMKQIKEIKEK